ncbi:GNAT family N-acetyltransferase [Clostridiaceae bacterium HFYG-1003]|nr:GNAT family N-acetyltransferase [Clostridiaceae bacterium HFYG-1003]
MYYPEKINLNNPRAIREVRDWLARHFHLNYGPDAQATYVVRGEEELIATASRSGNVFKYFGIHPDHQGENLTSILLGALLDDAFAQGIYHYFIFTSPASRPLFQAAGFQLVMENEYAALLESGNRDINSYLGELRQELGEPAGTRGAIVMNLNPMTLGHLYLIETARRQVDELIIFLVEEDLSLVPFRDRLAIAREAARDLPGVKVLPGGPYIISQATFPTYFLKRMDDELAAYTTTDAGIFANYYARQLGITHRFVGEEPLDPVTGAYNEALARELGKTGIAFSIIPRVEAEGGVISASRVRRHLARDEYEQAFRLVPPATRRYLESTAGADLITKIKAEEANIK